MIVASEKANQAVTKRHNARLVFKTIYDHELISRAEIARLTNLTATTVSNVIGELIGEGVVEEVGSVSTERGKPPTLVGLCRDARHVLALNLAQNVFRGGIFNLRGDLLHQQCRPAAGLQGEDALKTVQGLVDALLPHTSRPLLGIGVGAPGLIDAAHGVINRAVNLRWYDLPLAQLLSERYGLPIHVVNDNQASLLAEHLFGHYRNLANLVVIRVGRGIGAGIMANGQLLQHTGAGEIGHVTVVEQGERCSCGNDGCLETVASSRAIVERARNLLADYPHTRLATFVSARGELDIQAVIDAWRAGDTFLDPIVEDVGRYLGIAIAHLIGILGSTRVLLCGSVTGFGEPLLRRIREEVEQRSFTAQLQPPAIDLVSLESDIIMLGATALLLKHELGLF
ncbi:MAG: ROK family transcriptional regulator [Chloroflexi bacterium]|nr:MAG: ROK family transcriptional regulator [Chloroflexota bacterium]